MTHPAAFGVATLGESAGSQASLSTGEQTSSMLPIVGIRPLSGRTGTTLLMNLLGTSPQIAFDRRYPAEYRVASYLARTASAMTEPFDDSRHQGVTDFFFGEAPSLGPLPFASDALEVDAWRPALLRAMWSSASEAMLAIRPGATWYAEKLAVDEVALIDAGISVLRVDLVRDPRDILASRRAFQTNGTEGWARDADVVGAELTSRIDELDHDPPEIRLRYEDLAGDLAGTAERLGKDLGVELRAEAVARLEHHVTTTSVEASIGRWHRDLTSADADALAPIVKRLGYSD